ncbi:MAG: amidohydrolase family protein, partial [Candidatus Eremiobacteraeota bacterium]|nr:amidohydrolase family protein [Candidatus Eremiobacteraeota bacterium]
MRIAVAGDGTILSVTSDDRPENATVLSGPVLPGIPNLHSHAFQRALAGRLEGPGTHEHDFWSWRAGVYALVERIQPDDLEAIAAQAFLEMLEAGYTAVAEFHYLHHAAGGEPYANRAEMSERMVGAARRAGIGLTLLLTLYEFADFGGAPVSAAQQRFVTPVRKLVELHGALERRYFGAPDLRFGFAPHSLRAVSPESFAALQNAARGRFPRPPMHVHAAEQQKEVEDCVAWRGARPVAWLLENADPGLPWTFVHATHVDASE